MTIIRIDVKRRKILLKISKWISMFFFARYNWSIHMVADDEIIDYSVSYSNVYLDISSRIRIDIRCCSTSVDSWFISHDQTQTKYNHSNDVSRYRSIYSQSQFSDYCLWIYCPSISNLQLVKCQSPSQRFQLFNCPSSSCPCYDHAYSYARRCFWTLLWYWFLVKLLLWAHLFSLDLAVAPVARLLHFQNKPLITMGAVSNEFTLQRQTMYSTLFRFGYRTDELG